MRSGIMRSATFALLLLLPLASHAFEVQAGVFGGIRGMQTFSQYEAYSPAPMLGADLRVGFVVEHLTFELGYAHGEAHDFNGRSFNALEAGVRLRNRNWRISPTAAAHLMYSWDRVDGFDELSDAPAVLNTRSEAVMLSGGVAAHVHPQWSILLDATAGLGGPDGLHAIQGRLGVGYQF